MGEVPELQTALAKLAIPSERKSISVKCDWTLEREPLEAPHIQRLGKALATRPKITDVSLQGFVLNHDAVDTLSQIAVSRQLVQLDLSFCRIGDKSTDDVCNIINQGKMEWLDLTFNSIGLLGTNRIAKAIDTSICSLRVLSLRYNPITSFGLGLLLKFGKTLVTIDARCCGILCGDESKEREYGMDSIIAGFECNKCIERVLLQGNGFLPEDETRIYKAIANSATSRMSRETCPISDPDVDPFLAGLVSLNATMKKYNELGSKAAIELRKDASKPIPEVHLEDEEIFLTFESISQLENPEPASPLVELDYETFDLERKSTIPLGWGNTPSDGDSTFSEESGIAKVNSIMRVNTPTSCASLSPRYRRRFLRRMTQGSDDILNELSRIDTIPLGIEGRFRGSWQLLASIMKTTPESSPKDDFARRMSSDAYRPSIGSNSFGGLPPPEVPVTRKELPNVPDVKRLDSIIIKKTNSVDEDLIDSDSNATIAADSDDIIETEPPSPPPEEDEPVGSSPPEESESDAEQVATVPPSPVEERFLTLPSDVNVDNDDEDDEQVPTVPPSPASATPQPDQSIDDTPLSSKDDEQAPTEPPSPASATPQPDQSIDDTALSSKDDETPSTRGVSDFHRCSDSQDYAVPIINRYGGGPRGWPETHTKTSNRPIKNHPKVVTSATRSSVAKAKPVALKTDVSEELWRASPGMWPERTLSYDKAIPPGVSDRLAQQTYSSMQRSQTFSPPDAKQQHLINTTEVVDNPIRAIAARGTNEKSTYMLLEAALSSDECAKSLLGSHAFSGLGFSCGAAQGLPDFLKQYSGYPSSIQKLSKSTPSRASAVAKLLHMLVDPASGAKPEPGAERVLRAAHRRRLTEQPTIKKNDFKTSLALLRQIRWSRKKPRGKRTRSPPREEDFRLGVQKNKAIFEPGKVPDNNSSTLNPPRRASIDTYDSFTRSSRRGSLDQQRISRFNSAILPHGKGLRVPKRSPSPPTKPKQQREPSPPSRPSPEPIIVSSNNKKDSMSPKRTRKSSPIRQQRSRTPDGPKARKPPPRLDDPTSPKIKKTPRSPIAGSDLAMRRQFSDGTFSPKSKKTPRSPAELALRRQLSDGVYGIVSTGKRPGSQRMKLSSSGEGEGVTSPKTRTKRSAFRDAVPPSPAVPDIGDLLVPKAAKLRTTSPTEDVNRKSSIGIPSRNSFTSPKAASVSPRRNSVPAHKIRTSSPAEIIRRQNSAGISSRGNSLTHQHPRSRSPVLGFTRTRTLTDRFSRIDSLPSSISSLTRSRSSFSFQRGIKPSSGRPSQPFRLSLSTVRIPNS